MIKTFLQDTKKKEKGVWIMSNEMLPNEGELYTLRHLTLFTGLTDRTLRNYLHLGLLEGEKINGLWHFSPQQVERFLHHPAVRPSIQARENSVVYDFLLDDHKKTAQICIILDLPGAKEKETAEFFCYEISNNASYHDLQFAFDSVTGVPRITLRGPAEQITGLTQKYFQA